MNSIKNKLHSLLEQLPDNCSVEDIQYHLYVFQKVNQSLRIANSEHILEQEQVERLLSKWLIE